MENEYAFRHLMVLLQRLRTFPVVLEEVIFDVYYAIVFNAFSLLKVLIPITLLQVMIKEWP